MYKFYVVPDATAMQTHAELYTQKLLLWDPSMMSDAYAIVDHVTKEELNKAATLEFTILPTNVQYNNIYRKKSVIIVYDDDEWLFEGVVTESPVDFYKKKKITCSSSLVHLCDSIQPPDEKEIIEIPNSENYTSYVKIADDNVSGSNPKQRGWYERVIDENTGEPTVDPTTHKIQYKPTTDQIPVVGKKYYDKIVGDGENHTGLTVSKRTSTDETIPAHITRLLALHNDQVDPFKQINPGVLSDPNEADDETKTYPFKSANYRNTWDALKSDITDEYGRYFRLRLDSQFNLVLDYLKMSQMTYSNTPKIEFADNMIEMSENDKKDEELFTVLLPTGKNNLTLESLDPNAHNSPEHGDGREIDPYVKEYIGKRQFVIVSNAAVARYGRIFKPQSFGDVSDAETLYSRAVRYIRNNFDSNKEYEVKAIEAHIIDKTNRRIILGDKCKLISAWHGTDEQNLYVISAERHYMEPNNDSYVIGVPTTDREAKNKTLTGQSAKARSKADSDAASSASGMSAMGSILDNYIKATEWGLQAHSRLSNEVESNDKLYKTRFEQDEYHLGMYAQKIFGYNDDKIQDGTFLKVPKPYESSANPKASHWCEYNSKTGKYFFSKDETADAEKNYYILNIVTRVADLVVGDDGIHGTVKGNYERSTASASWIKANENQLLALTGHMYVNEDNQIVIKAGSGLRTSHSSRKYDLNDNEKFYRQIPTSVAEGQNPKKKGWYERVFSADGSWDGTTYKATDDTTAFRNKFYYELVVEEEEFLAEYGIYDEKELTAGIIARTINNPSYYPVPYSALKIKNVNPSAMGWWVYNDDTGTYGQTLDDHVVEGTKYYLRDNGFDESKEWTAIKGDHVTVGYYGEKYIKVDESRYAGKNPKKEGWYTKTVNPLTLAISYVLTNDETANYGKEYYRKREAYSGMDPDQKAKIDKYIEANDLFGTITEVASDVVSVNALFARFISFDEADGIVITAKSGYYDRLTVQTTTGDGWIWADGVTATSLSVNEVANVHSMYLKGVLFGSYATEGEEEDSEFGNDPSEIVMGFGTITTSGDTVKIPYRVAGDGALDPDNPVYAHELSFDKPAALGNAVWRSGGVLDVYTVGGYNNGNPKWTFYHANIDIPTNYTGTDSEGQAILTYNKKGSELGVSAASGLSNVPTIKARMIIRGDDRDKDNNAVSFPHDQEEDSPVMAWSKDIFINAQEAFNDGVDSVKFDRVSWQSGEKLSVYLENKNNPIFTADLNIPETYHENDLVSHLAYYKNGQRFTALQNNGNFANRPTMQATVYIEGTWTGETHDPEEDGSEVPGWSGKKIYIDAKLPYDDGHEDGISYAKARIGASEIGRYAAGTLTQEQVIEIYNNDVSYGLRSGDLEYDTYYRYAATYDGTVYGKYRYVKTPIDRFPTGYSACAATVRTHSYQGSTGYLDNGHIDVGYEEEIKVVAQYMAYGDDTYTDCSENGIVVKGPVDRYVRGIDDEIGTVATYAYFANDHVWDDGEIHMANHTDTVKVYAKYQPWNSSTGQFGSNTLRNGIEIFPPPDKAVGVQGVCDDVTTTGTSEGVDLPLGYDKTIVVKGRYSVDGWQTYVATDDYITITTPSDNWQSGYDDGVNWAKTKISASAPSEYAVTTEEEAREITGAGRQGRYTSLDYNKYYRYKGKLDGTEYGLYYYIYVPEDRYVSGKMAGRSEVSLVGPTQEANQDISVLAYNTTYSFCKKYGDEQIGDKVYFKTPHDAAADVVLNGPIDTSNMSFTPTEEQTAASSRELSYGATYVVYKTKSASDSTRLGDWRFFRTPPNNATTNVGSAFQVSSINVVKDDPGDSYELKNDLKSYILSAQSASNEKHWVVFTVSLTNGISGSKKYKMYFGS